ncbi:hypothetical protein B0H13DRAFT_1983271 [Mycena leptocephala]|nr:hypothetical protein B0H13DRAFT_1983271 [Mycena leptocephala]
MHATESVVIAPRARPIDPQAAMYELIRLAGYGQTEREDNVPVFPRLHDVASAAAPAEPVDPGPCTRHGSGIADDYMFDPLCGLQALIDTDWAAEGYCEACVKLRREVWSHRREKIWDNLNIWFGLD